ncbi:MAG: hydroxymyristoyl-ACP dehydratase [Parafilimonas sp.]|nr:hydroxymyristoyl-ACP dehydratase [Parafilimonas sp.]
MYESISEKLPYKSSFRFVDEITALDENGVTGNYTLKKDAFFYEDHFPDHPVTPGVIVTEIMAQIGLVVLGIFLLNKEEKNTLSINENIFPVFTSTQVEFLKMALPGEKVIVVSKKQYFRFNKLKCYIEMMNGQGDLIARGTFAGIIKKFDLNQIFL